MRVRRSPRWIPTRGDFNLGLRAGAAVSDGEITIVASDPADRRDDGSGAAGEAFDEAAACASARHWSIE